MRQENAKLSSLLTNLGNDNHSVDGYNFRILSSSNETSNSVADKEILRCGADREKERIAREKLHKLRMIDI